MKCFNRLVNEVCLVVVPKSRSPLKWFSVLAPIGAWCLLTRWGKYAGIAKPGKSFHPPWIRVSHCVTQQAVVYDAPVERAITQDNIRVSIDIVLVFRVFDPYPFVYTLGASNFDALLTGVVEESVRLLARRTLSTDFLELRGDTAWVLLRELNKRFDEFGLVFDDCMVKDIRVAEKMVECRSSIATLAVEMAVQEREHRYLCTELEIRCDVAVKAIMREGETGTVGPHGGEVEGYVPYNAQELTDLTTSKCDLAIAAGDPEACAQVLLASMACMFTRHPSPTTPPGGGGPPGGCTCMSCVGGLSGFSVYPGARRPKALAMDLGS